MPGRYEDRVLRVLDYIHDHTANDLSLDQLADVAAMSRFHWHRVFSAMMGRPAADVIRAVRMHKASILLVHTDTPIREVGPEVGYANPRSFSRVFRETYGVTPRDFRARGAALSRFPSPRTGDHPMFDVEIKDLPATRMVALTHKGSYSEISKAFQKLGMLLGAGNHWPQTRGGVGVYYDDPTTTPDVELRSHAGVVWAGGEAPDGLDLVELDGGKYAVLHFKGPYSGLQAAYDYFYGPWLSEADVTLRDAPSFELYPNSPMDTAPDDLLTDICMPLA